MQPDQTVMFQPLADTRRPGDHVTWRTLDGSTYFGVLKEWDYGKAIVVGVDGKERAV